jgi:tungstate transport system substrate-binding protein
VHARAAEDKFIAEGHGINRRDVMYNDFIIVGPVADPAGLKGSKDVINALRKLVASKAKFISRGDNSGTDQMEQAYWKEAGVKPAGSAYVSAGLGMGEVLTMAAQMQAYTLTDRATYGAYKAKTGLDVQVEGDAKMFNPYGIIAVNPAKYKDINIRGANSLIEWMTSAEGQKKIADYKVDGQQLFFLRIKNKLSFFSFFSFFSFNGNGHRHTITVADISGSAMKVPEMSYHHEQSIWIVSISKCSNPVMPGSKAGVVASW